MIELDKNYNSDSDTITLSQDLLDSLPRPISELISQLETENDPQLRLQTLCLSLIPMTFQYFALILSSEYLFSEDPPDIDVMDNLWGMIRRPGAGKWISFLRSATEYFSDRNTKVIQKEAIHAFQGTLLSDKRPRVKFPDGKKLDYYEALINMRNRFAHSRQIPKDRAEELFSDYFIIWKALLCLLPDAFEPRVLIVDDAGTSYNPYDNRDFNPDSIKPSETDAPLILWNDKINAWLKMFPLVIAMYETETQNGEALLLEEVKGKTLLYLYRDTVVKRKEEFRHLIQLLDTRTVQVERISSEELTVSIFGERIDRITKNTLMDFEDTLKYIPGMFVERESFSKRLDSWLDDERPGCILVGEPGVGKTSLVADWSVKRRDKGDHVLLLEASKLDSSDVSGLLEKILNLGSPLNNCFDSVNRQNIDIGSEGNSKRFIIIIDAINEFVGTGFDNRTVLWREINSLIDRIDGYRPYFKCLVTTRSDLWKSDFPKKDSTDYTLKRRLYYSDNGSGFPLITVGSLTYEDSEEIYEKARKSISGMAPLTPYKDLPESTKRLILNPFSLRLVLQTFNDKEVPTLTEGKLNHQFAKEKILEEKEKKEILFKLLERMSEVRKTEISLNEFLYGKKEKTKIGRKTRKQNEELEKIIFDPRPNSPYKQLQTEGIIEERTVGDGENAEERFKFSQEKILQIMYEENKQKIGSPIILVLFGIIIELGIAISIYWDIISNTNIIQDIIYNSSLTYEQAETSLIKIQPLMRQFFIVLMKAFNKIFIPVLLFSIYVFYKLGNKKTKKKKLKIIDVTDLYIKIKVLNLAGKYFFYFSIPVYIYFIYAWLKMLLYFFKNSSFPEQETNLYIHCSALFILCFLVSKVFVVIKFGKTPQYIYYMFGHKVARESINVLLKGFLVIFIVMYIVFKYFGIVELAMYNEINQLNEKWRKSNEYAVLYEKNQNNDHDSHLLNDINAKLPFYDMKVDEEIISESLLNSLINIKLLKSLYVPAFILLTIYHILVWLLASPLEKLLRWKLARAP